MKEKSLRILNKKDNKDDDTFDCMSKDYVLNSEEFFKTKDKQTIDHYYNNHDKIVMTIMFFCQKPSFCSTILLAPTVLPC